MSYARHLARGNYFAGDMSWTKPGSPPIVLAHGFMGTRGTMIPLTQRFQADGRVVFSYHHGTFQLRSLRASAQQLVEHLARLERELSVSRVDLVGFSMGGLIALHAVKFMQAHRWIRRLALLGSPTNGTWAGLAGVSTMGLVSPSVWQVLPTSGFLRDLRDAPLPEGVRVRQISAAHDAFCPLPDLLEGVDKERDYVVIPGGHSSLVVARPFYNKLREFFDEPEPTPEVLPTTAEVSPASAPLVEPVLTEPVLTEPVLTEPVLTESVLAEPVLAESLLAEPVLAEPVLAESELTEPSGSDGPGDSSADGAAA